jgi:hypothetical protein
LADRWDLDPILVRGGFVALSLFGGLGVVAYGLGWLLLPQRDGRIHLQQAIRGDITAGFVGALLLSLAAIGGGGSDGPWHDGFWFGWFFPGGLLLSAAVVFGIWWLARNSQRGEGNTHPSPTVHAGAPSSAAASTAVAPAPSHTFSSAPSTSAPSAAAPAWGTVDPEQLTKASKARKAALRPPKRVTRLTLGLALLTGAGVAAIGSASDWSRPTGVIASASALLVMAAGIIVCGLMGRRARGLAGLSVILAACTLTGAGVHDAGVRSGQHLAVVGSTDWRPSSAEDASKQFNLGLGDARLSLTDPAIVTTGSAEQPVRVRVRVGAGQLVVVVPDNVSTRLDVQIGAGELIYPDGSVHKINNGRDFDNNDRRARDFDNRRSITTGGSGTPRIVVDIQQGAGQIEIRTASGVAVGRSDSFLPATPTASVSPAPSAPTASVPAPSATK